MEPEITARILKGRMLSDSLILSLPSTGPHSDLLFKEKGLELPLREARKGSQAGVGMGPRERRN